MDISRKILKSILTLNNSKGYADDILLNLSNYNFKERKYFITDGELNVNDEVLIYQPNNGYKLLNNGEQIDDILIMEKTNLNVTCILNDLVVKSEKEITISGIISIIDDSYVMPYIRATKLVENEGIYSIKGKITRNKPILYLIVTREKVIDSEKDIRSNFMNILNLQDLTAISDSYQQNTILQYKFAKTSDKLENIQLLHYSPEIGFFKIIVYDGSEIVIEENKKLVEIDTIIKPMGAVQSVINSQQIDEVKAALSDNLTILLNKIEECKQEQQKIQTDLESVKTQQENLQTLKSSVDEIKTTIQRDERQIDSNSDRVGMIEKALPISSYIDKTVYDRTTDQILEVNDRTIQKIANEYLEKKEYNEDYDNALGELMENRMEIEELRSNIEATEKKLNESSNNINELMTKNDKRFEEIKELSKQDEKLQSELDERLNRITKLDDEIEMVERTTNELMMKVRAVPKVSEIIGGIDKYTEKLRSTGKVTVRQGYYNVPPLGMYTRDVLLITNEGNLLNRGINRLSVIERKDPTSITENYTITVNFSKMVRQEYRACLIYRNGDTIDKDITLIKFETILHEFITYAMIPKEYTGIISNLLYVTSGKFVYV